MPQRKRRTGRTVTILDVARQARVSPMTASRVMNDNPRVGSDMRQRVLAAAKELNYRPNLAGRSLRASSATRIGVLYSNPSAAYLNQLILGVLEETSLTGVQVLVEKCAGLRSQRAAMQRLLDAGVDGVILPPPLCDSRITVKHLDDADVAVVAVASGEPLEGVASVRIDDYQGACAMTRHLIRLGHRRIGFIQGDPRHSPARLRLQGFLDTMAKAGLEVPDGMVAHGLFTYRSGLSAARALLEGDPRPTAIFSSNDDMAAAVVAVAHGMGLHVPQDLSIAGFDDTPVATTVWPSLTTIHQPVTAMGRAAVRLMLQTIQRHRAGDHRAPAQQIMKYTLIKRESSASP